MISEDSTVRKLKMNMELIFFAADESGWAEKKDDEYYVVRNVPLTDGIHIDDVVEVDANKVVVRVVSRKYREKMDLEYIDINQGKEFLRRINKELDARAEGMYEPMFSREKFELEPGLIVVCHNESPEALEKLALECGIDLG